MDKLHGWFYWNFHVYSIDGVENSNVTQTREVYYAMHFATKQFMLEDYVTET